MIFSGVKNNLKLKNMMIVKIIMAFALFVVISEKSLLPNLINNNCGGNINFCSVEKFVCDIINLSRVINTSFSLTIGVGIVITEIVLILGISLVVFYAIKTIGTRLVRKESSLDNQNVHEVAYATNNIYLVTSKFIC